MQFKGIPPITEEQLKEVAIQGKEAQELLSEILRAQIFGTDFSERDFARQKNLNRTTLRGLRSKIEQLVGLNQEKELYHHCTTQKKEAAPSLNKTGVTVPPLYHLAKNTEKRQKKCSINEQNLWITQEPVDNSKILGIARQPNSHHNSTEGRTCFKIGSKSINLSTVRELHYKNLCQACQEDFEDIFNHYRQEFNMKNSHVRAKSFESIKTALINGFTKEDILKAISGYKHANWMKSKTATISYILWDDERISMLVRLTEIHEEEQKLLHLKDKKSLEKQLKFTCGYEDRNESESSKKHCQRDLTQHDVHAYIEGKPICWWHQYVMKANAGDKQAIFYVNSMLKTE